MKSIILPLLLIVSGLASAASLPQSWVSEGEGRKSLSSFKELNETQEYLSSVLSIQEKVLLGREEKSLGGFKFSTYVTDFSVSKSGLFGLSALKATTAVELKWKNVQTQIIPEAVADMEVLDDSAETLAATASELEAKIVATGKVASSPALKSNIESVLNKAKLMMDQMEHRDVPGWKLAAFRLDLSIGANGQVWTFAKTGASVRLRLDWKKIKRKQNNKLMANNKTGGLVDKILYDFSQVYQSQDLLGFKVKMVNVGVGLSRKGGLLGLASTKLGIVGFLRFVPVTTTQSLPALADNTSALATEDMEYVADEISENKSMNNIFVPRKKWRAGLEKGFAMAKYFASSAERFQNRWQVTEVKTVLELTKSGFLGLASTSVTGAIETELVRK